MLVCRFPAGNQKRSQVKLFFFLTSKKTRYLAYIYLPCRFIFFTCARKTLVRRTYTYTIDLIWAAATRTQCCPLMPAVSNSHVNLLRKSRVLTCWHLCRVFRSRCPATVSWLCPQRSQEWSLAVADFYHVWYLLSDWVDLYKIRHYDWLPMRLPVNIFVLALQFRPVSK